MNIEHFTLTNEFKTYIYEEHSNPLISAALFVKSGSAFEQKDEIGFSHFIEHLVFKSTKKFPKNSIMEKISNIGGSINAYTSHDITCFYITLPSNYFETAIEALAELCQHANFSKKEFEIEKKIVIEELKQSHNNPIEFFTESILEHYYIKGPYKNPIGGSLENLKDVTAKDLRDFYTKYYLPNNSFLVVSGDLKLEQSKFLIKKYFHEWQNRPVKIRTPLHIINENNFKTFTHQAKNDVLAFTLPEVKESHPDFYPLIILAKAFTIGKSSRIYKRLYENEDLTDLVKYYSYNGKYSGIGLILIIPKQKNKLNKITDIFLQELSLLIRFGLSFTEIESHKRELIYEHKYTFEHVESLTQNIGSFIQNKQVKDFANYEKDINNVSKQQINEVLRKYYNFNHLKQFYLGHNANQLNDFNHKIKKHIRKITNPNKLQKRVLETKLDNGLKLIFRKVKGKSNIGIAMDANVSSLNEPSDRRGINILTAKSILYNNHKRNYQEILNFCSNNGISLGISPSMDSTTFKAKCFKEMLPQTIQLLSDIVIQPKFSQKYMQKFKGSILNNLELIKDYPEYHAQHLWKKYYFGSQSNAITYEGSKTTIKNISLKQIKQWFEDYYFPSNLTISLVGDFNFSIIENLIKELFSINKTNNNIKKSPILETAREKIKIKDNNSNQSIINLGGAGCSTDKIQSNLAFHILAQLIGGSTNSLFFKTLREKMGLAYSVNFDFYSNLEFGYFLANAVIDRNNTKNTIQIIEEILLKIKDSDFINEEFEKTKNYIRGQRLIAEESMLSQAIALARLITTGKDYQFFKNRHKRLDNIQLQEIKNIAETYFYEDNFYTYVLT